MANPIPTPWKAVKQNGMALQFAAEVGNGWIWWIQPRKSVIAHHDKNVI